jgi:hypothetical protein
MFTLNCSTCGRERKYPTLREMQDGTQYDWVMLHRPASTEQALDDLFCDPVCLQLFLGPAAICNALGRLNNAELKRVTLCAAQVAHDRSD